MKTKIFVFLLIATSLTLTGCDSMGANTKKGAGLGGLLGAVAGGVVGHQTGHGVEGALIGGAAGALGGGMIGKGIDDSKETDQSQTTATPQSSSSARVSILKVVEMTKSGIPAEAIIDELKTTGSTYVLDTDTVKYLQDNGVDYKVINYMLAGK